MDNDTLTLDDSSDNGSTLSEQPKLNLVRETELGVHPTTISNDSIGHNKFKTDSSHQVVGKILPQGALDKTRAILEGDPNLLLEKHKHQPLPETEERKAE